MQVIMLPRMLSLFNCNHHHHLDVIPSIIVKLNEL